MCFWFAQSNLGARKRPWVSLVQGETKVSKKVSSRTLQSNRNRLRQVSWDVFIINFLLNMPWHFPTDWDSMVKIVFWELCVKVPSILIRKKETWSRNFWKQFSGEFETKRWYSFFIKLLFSVPKTYMSQMEHPDIHEYSNVYNYNCRENGCHRRKRAPSEISDCETEYSNCEFSLLEMLLGRYAVEPTKHGPVINVPFMWFFI